MNFDPSKPDCGVPEQQHFVTTRWTLVVRGAVRNPDGRRALGELFALYWYPLYAYTRRRGVQRADAEDLVQDFLRSLLERNDLAGLDPARGRFRAFLLAALRNFLANEWDRRRAKKRGGNLAVVSIDADGMERRFRDEVVFEGSAEDAFERGFALELIERSLAALAAEWQSSGRAAIFERLVPLLTPGAHSYGQVGDAVGMTEAAVKMAVLRLRRRLAHLLRSEIRDIVLDDDDVDEEIHALFAALGRRGGA